MTELFQNIVNEPGELIKSLDFTCAPERDHLQDAAKLVKKSSRVFITGIGSSWHAGMAITALMARYGTPPTLVDASELLHFTEFPANSVVIALSRSGKSVEIVQLLKKARASKTAIIGVTNTPESPLAQQADVTLLMHAAFDRNVSITMYSALTLIGGLIAEAAYGKFNDTLRKSLKKSLEATNKCLPAWTETIRKSAWCAAEPAYFLARGSSLASCHEARLLWEEVAKFPASAMTTGGFRHGPQEILCEGMRICLWIDGTVLRKEDLALAKDLQHYGAKTFLIGQDIPANAGDMVINVPKIESRWQFLTDIIPAQIASEHLATLRGKDADNFQICPYIIDSEGGLKK